MGKTVAVSFEESGIKIVHASLKGNSLSVEKTETVDYFEFETYLQNEKAAEFVVTYDFREAHHGILETPAVKTKYLTRIVESEIRKATSLKDISFVYTPVGEKVVENRKRMEVFYFAVNNEVLRDVVDRFYEFGKVVKAVYPTVFSAASMVDVQTAGEANLGVMGSGRERMAFFTMKGKVYFMRNYESIEPEFSDYDVQNLNMTISYCIQNIKKNPSSVLILGNLSESSSLSTLTSKPLVCLAKADYIHCPRDTFNEFVLPVASFYAPGSSNILNRDFKSIYMLNNYLAYASKAFVLFAIICIGFILYEIKGIADTKVRMNEMKTANEDVAGIFSGYAQREDRIGQYLPAVEFLNRSAPSIQSLLLSFSQIDLGELKFNSVAASAAGDNTFSVVISGDGFAGTYSSMQTSFNRMLERFKEIGGVKITDTAVDLNRKSFEIRMDYRASNKMQEGADKK